MAGVIILGVVGWFTWLAHETLEAQASEKERERAMDKTMVMSAQLTAVVQQRHISPVILAFLRAIWRHCPEPGRRSRIIALIESDVLDNSAASQDVELMRALELLEHLCGNPLAWPLQEGRRGGDIGLIHELEQAERLVGVRPERPASAPDEG